MSITSKGLALNLKYSIAPNSLGYCGCANSDNTFINFVKNPNKNKLKKTLTDLESFTGVKNYCEFIGKCNSLKKFDDRVLNAYWIGNELLKQASGKKIQNLIKSFYSNGLITKETEQKMLSKNLNNAIPHHSFHVLFFTSFSKKLKKNIENKSNCLITWGKILEEKNSKFLVNAVILQKKNKKIKLVEKQKTINKSLCNGKIGKIFSINWNTEI